MQNTCNHTHSFRTIYSLESEMELNVMNGFDDTMYRLITVLRFLSKYAECLSMLRMKMDCVLSLLDPQQTIYPVIEQL